MKLLVLLMLGAAMPAMEVHCYCFGFLNAHEERAEIPEARAQEIQKGHMEHMQPVMHVWFVADEAAPRPFEIAKPK